MATKGSPTNTPKNSAAYGQTLRCQAEEIVRMKSVHASGAHPEKQPPEEMEQALHELRVHQIELELQNEELRRAQLDLDAARARYFDLYDLAPVGYCTLSEKGLIMESNLTAATLLGVPRSTLTNQPIQHFIFKDDQDLYYTHCKRLFEDSESHTCQLRLVNHDGTSFWVHLSETLSQDADGTAVRRVVLSDITEQMQKKEELRIVKEEAETANAANAAKSQFLANMSHQIRTPMNGFMGSLQLMEMTELSDEQQKYLRLSMTSSDLLLAVINDILDYSKIEAGMMELAETDLVISEVIQDAIDIFQPFATKKGLIIKSAIEEDVPDYLIGDPFKLRQVLGNLLGNAVKFTDEGIIDIFVRKIEDIDNRMVKLVFTVKDTGIGIPADRTELLFKSFSQIDSSTTRQYGGTGLGLAIAKSLAEMMSGEIRVESKEGEGSSFLFTCVLKSGTGEDSAAACVKTAQTYAQKDHLVRLLLVEDDELSWMLIRELARKKGWNVIVAENGEEAVEAFQKMRFDVILMDVQMPVMDGYTATRIIRQMETLIKTHTPIIAMTAYALKGDKEKCLEAGMDDYLSKPVKFDELERCCLDWISLTGDDVKL